MADEQDPSQLKLLGTAILSAMRRVTVHCPLQTSTLGALTTVHIESLTQDPVVSRILAIIEGSTELGNFGRYRGVYELAIGIEGFTPHAGSQPTVGREGERIRSATATIVTYVPADVPAERLAELLNSLASAHPWELPVIEVADVYVYRSDLQKLER